MSLTDEQKALRRSGIGASEIATLVGIGPGKLIDVFEAKVLGEPPDLEDDENLVRDLGTLLEDPVAVVYAKRTKSFLARVDTVRHPSKTLALCTPDRARFLSEAALKAVALNGPISSLEALLTADRLVEVKTTGGRYRRDYGAPGSATVPEEKAVVATWQMGVTGIKVLDMPVLFRSEYGVRVDTFTLSFNESLFEGLYEAAERFWVDHVEPRNPPPPDASERYDDFLKRAFPNHGRPPIIAGPDDEELMMRYAKLSEAESRIEKARKGCRQELVSRIADAEGLTSARFGTLTYRRTKDSQEVDWERGCNEALNLAALCIEAFEPGENRTGLEQALKAIVPDATKKKSGYRALRATWRGEAALELARLQMALEPIDPKDPK